MTNVLQAACERDVTRIVPVLCDAERWWHTSSDRSHALQDVPLMARLCGEVAAALGRAGYPVLAKLGRRGLSEAACAEYKGTRAASGVSLTQSLYACLHVQCRPCRTASTPASSMP